MDFQVECTADCGFFGSDDCNACSERERFVRMHMTGATSLAPMTSEQRQWCVDEADLAGEGRYPASKTHNLSDMDLAATVLAAWWDYVRSNCL